MKDTEQEDVALTSWADEPIMLSALVAAIAAVGGA